VADEVSASVDDSFSEAGSTQFQFIVNPDGSIFVEDPFGNLSGPVSSVSSPFGGWELDVNGQGLGPHGSVPLLDVPALPPGSTINSATFSLNLTTRVYAVESNVNWTVQGSLALQSIEGVPCVPLATPLSSNYTCSFMPGTTSETLYSPDFSGGSDAVLVADLNIVPGIPLEPGSYFAGVNISADAEMTITEDYSTTPEPRTYALLVGLGLVGLFTAKSRRKTFSHENGCDVDG
jgi:hypothetical protein